MNGTVAEATSLIKTLVKGTSSLDRVDMAVCPPYTLLAMIAPWLRGSRMSLGAQNMHWEAKGAYTGEISGLMLKEAGVRYVVVGHSERRTLFGETEETVNKKVKAAFAQGLEPILCVGETLMEREKMWTQKVVERQMAEGLDRVSPEQVVGLTVAYEPVWAIGTGKTATPEQVVEVHQWIRRQVAEMHGVEVAEKVRIQYGGSVTPENCESLLKHVEIDGALVGGASLKAESFIKIVEVAQACTYCS